MESDRHLHGRAGFVLQIAVHGERYRRLWMKISSSKASSPSTLEAPPNSSVVPFPLVASCIAHGYMRHGDTLAAVIEEHNQA